MTIHSAIASDRCGCDDRRREGLLPLDEAVEIARSLAVTPVDTETVALRQAAGRVAALDTHAPRPMPFFDQSAMDGFAVRAAEFAGRGPWRLRVAGTAAAGDRLSGDCLPQGCARRIYTGAPLPAGADAVAVAEDCDEADGAVAVRRRPRRGDNVRRLGADIARGALLLRAGTRIEPRHVGLLAANGLETLKVFRRPRVGVFSTGSELLSDHAPEEGRVFDSNRPMLVALAQGAGAEVADLGIVDDDPHETARFFARHAGAFDMLVSSGAVSAGGRDFVGPSFVAAGGSVRAWKVALKPGKPVLLGTLGRTAFLGLPGNPLAAFVGFELFGREQISRMGGATEANGGQTRALAGFCGMRKTGRTEFVPARVVSRSAEGLPILELVGNGSSGTLLALCQADGLAVFPAQLSRFEAGDPLGFIAFGPELAGPFHGDPE